MYLLRLRAILGAPWVLLFRYHVCGELKMGCVQSDLVGLSDVTQPAACARRYRYWDIAAAKDAMLQVRLV